MNKKSKIVKISIILILRPLSKLDFKKELH